MFLPLHRSKRRLPLPTPGAYIHYRHAIPVFSANQGGDIPQAIHPHTFRPLSADPYKIC